MSELVELEVTLTNAPKLAPKDSEYVDNFDLGYNAVRKLNGLNKDFVRRTDRKVKNKYTSKQIESDETLGYTYLDCVTPPHNIDYLAKLYDISPAHHAAVNAKAASVIGLGYRWVETTRFKNAKSSATAAKLKKLDKQLDETMMNIEEWIENINPVDCFDEVLRKIWIDYETTGNAYMEIGRDATGKIRYVGQIPARWMRVRRERDGFVQIFSNQIRYFRNFGDTNPNPITDDRSPNEVIHFKKYSPMNAYYGVPDIFAAKNALAGNEFASRYNLDYFENKAVPKHVIIAKGSGLSPNSVNRLVEFFESGLRGQHHRSIFVPLSKDSDAEIEFKAIESESQDSSFSTYREANNEEIFMAHDIPATRAGVFGSNISLAAAATANKVFKETYSRPEQAIFEKKFNKIIRSMTDVVSFKLEELSLTDADTQSKIDEREVRMGIQVPDEVRAGKGKPPRPDGEGNKPWQANSQQGAEQKAQSTRNRVRDSERSASASDSTNDPRQPKGSGRAAP